MKKQKQIAIFFVVICFLAACVMWLNLGNNKKTSNEVLQERVIKHNTDLKIIDSQWNILHQAYQAEKQKQFEKATKLFWEALQIGDQNVPRNALLRIYEETGQYEKALEQVEWFSKGNQNGQGCAETLKIKERLLKKIEGTKQT